jgi:ATP-binding cassette, subfamily C (CFTR/MRP), member 1
VHIVNRQVDLWLILLIDFHTLQNRCVRDAEQGLDMENRAYLMTISMQRWLAMRLDFFGNILILGIALFAAGFRTTVNPAKIGVVLTYTLGGRFMANI